MLNEPEGYIDHARVIRALLLDIVADYKRLSEEKLRLFLDPLEMWVYELFRRPLPFDWRDRLADYLAYWELDEGYTLSPESTRILNHAIEALAKRRGLLSAGDASGARSQLAARPTVVKAPVAIQRPSKPVAPTRSPPQSDWPKTSPEQRARNQANAESAAQSSAPANPEDPRWEHRFELFGRIARDRLLEFFQELAVEGRMARDIGDPKRADLEPLFVQEQWVDQAYFGYLQARIDIYLEWTRYLRLGRFAIGISILALLDKIERELFPRIEGLASPRDSSLSKARHESFEAFAKVQASLDRADAALVWTDRAIIPVVTLAGAVTQAAQQASAAALAEGLSPTAAHRIGLAAAVSHAAASEMAGTADSLTVVGDLIPPAVQDANLDERAIRAGLAVFLTLATLRTEPSPAAPRKQVPSGNSRKQPTASPSEKAFPQRPAENSPTNSIDPSGLQNINYIPGRVTLRDATLVPGNTLPLSSAFDVAWEVNNAFFWKNQKQCKLCEEIGIIQIVQGSVTQAWDGIPLPRLDLNYFWTLDSSRNDGTYSHSSERLLGAVRGDPTALNIISAEDLPGVNPKPPFKGAASLKYYRMDAETYVVCLKGLEGVTMRDVDTGGAIGRVIERITVYGGVSWHHEFTLGADGHWIASRPPVTRNITPSNNLAAVLRVLFDRVYTMP